MIWLLWQHFFLIRNYIQILCMNMALHEQLFGHVHVWRIQEKLAGKGELHTGYSTWESWVPTSSFFLFFGGGCLFVVLHCALLHQCYLYPPSCPPQQECHKVTFTAKVPMWGRGTYFVFSEFSILILLCVGEAWLLCMNFLLINKFFFLKLVLQIFLPIFKLKT